MKKFIRFVCTSGIGWLIDLSVYSLLVYAAGFPVRYANFISAIPAVTFVFFVSTKKTFENSPRRLKLKYKYLIYVLYQFVLVSLTSLLAEFISGQLSLVMTGGLSSLPQIAAKCVVTCITLCCNFITMKFLIEKV